MTIPEQYPDRYGDCRPPFGHVWKRLRGLVPAHLRAQRGRPFYWRCACGREKMRSYDADGNLVDQVDRYPAGYLTDGRARAVEWRRWNILRADVDVEVDDRVEAAS